MLLLPLGTQFTSEDLTGEILTITYILIYIYILILDVLLSTAIDHVWGILGRPLLPTVRFCPPSRVASLHPDRPRPSRCVRRAFTASNTKVGVYVLTGRPPRQRPSGRREDQFNHLVWGSRKYTPICTRR